MPLLRIDHLQEAVKEDEDRPGPKLPDTSLWHPTLANATRSPQSDGRLGVPKFSFENTTAFGKLSISDLSVDLWSPAKQMLENASARIDSCKEAIGINTFGREEVAKLSKSGIFDGPQWQKMISGQVMEYAAPSRSAYGSLTFSLPVETLGLMSQSAAFNALMALVTIASILGPVERDVKLIVSGALDGIFAQESDLGRPFLEDSLRRALLRGHALARSTRGTALLDRFISNCIAHMPALARRFCAASAERVKAMGIDASQLAAIAEWAFDATNPRTLVLWNEVEILAAVAAASFFNSKRVALVDCAEKTCKIFDDGASGSCPRLAIFYGGDAQQAITILHSYNWLQPVKADSKRISRQSPYMRLSCTVEAALSACPTFLQSAGVSSEDANYFMEAVKKDAISQFSKDIILSTDEALGFSYTSVDNLVHSYSYRIRGSPRDYNWDFWLGMSALDISRIMLELPSVSTGLGSTTYSGYAAQAILKKQSFKTQHEDYMKSLAVTHHADDSDISSALGEVSGLVYALALSAVHVLDMEEMRNFKVASGLGDGLKRIYSALKLSPASDATIPRSVCLGSLARLWLNVAEVFDVADLPQTSLGISNSQGAVMSAIFGQSKSLRDATTKFIVSADVPDITAGEKPVIACSSTPASKIQGRGYDVGQKPSTRLPFDGCWQISCLTITGGDPPSLKDRLANRISVVPVCGYIACGARWWEYVDLDNAFTVMSASEGDPCENCPSELEAIWLEQESFLQRDNESGFTAFSCALPKDGSRIVLPAYGNGLMQSFLCGVFRPSARKLRWYDKRCVVHTDCDVLIV
jgi:hypothetical protein